MTRRRSTVGLLRWTAGTRQRLTQCPPSSHCCASLSLFSLLRVHRRAACRHAALNAVMEREIARGVRLANRQAAFAWCCCPCKGLVDCCVVPCASRLGCLDACVPLTCRGPDFLGGRAAAIQLSTLPGDGCLRPLSPAASDHARLSRGGSSSHLPRARSSRVLAACGSRGGAASGRIPSDAQEARQQVLLVLSPRPTEGN